MYFFLFGRRYFSMDFLMTLFCKLMGSSKSRFSCSILLRTSRFRTSQKIWRNVNKEEREYWIALPLFFVVCTFRFSYKSSGEFDFIEVQYSFFFLFDEKGYPPSHKIYWTVVTLRLKKEVSASRISKILPCRTHFVNGILELLATLFWKAVRGMLRTAFSDASLPKFVHFRTEILHLSTEISDEFSLVAHCIW